MIIVVLICIIVLNLVVLHGWASHYSRYGLTSMTQLLTSLYFIVSLTQNTHNMKILNLQLNSYISIKGPVWDTWTNLTN